MLFPFFFVAWYVATAEEPYKVIVSRLWLIGAQAVGGFFNSASKSSLGYALTTSLNSSTVMTPPGVLGPKKSAMMP